MSIGLVALLSAEGKMSGLVEVESKSQLIYKNANQRIK